MKEYKIICGFVGSGDAVKIYEGVLNDLVKEGWELMGNPVSFDRYGGLHYVLAHLVRDKKGPY